MAGERYATSKRPQSRQWLGSRGEALASIIQVAQTVELTTRHRLSQHTCCKNFHSGRSSGPVPARERLRQPGTVVTVRHLFHNLPVRKKHASSSMELAKLRSALCQTLLVIPHLSLTLYDEQGGSRLLHAPRTSSLLARFGQLFGSKPAVQQAELRHGEAKLSGLFALQPLPRASLLQLIFMNRRQAESWLHTLVCRLLDSASISTAGSTRTDQRFFYVVVIEDEQWMEFCSSPADHLQQERRATAALSSLVCSFLTANNLPVNHCRPLSQVKSRYSLPSVSFRDHDIFQPTFSSSTAPHSQSHGHHTPPPSGQPEEWKLAVDPVSSQSLRIHPFSGCSLPAKSDQLPSPGQSYSIQLHSHSSSPVQRVRAQALPAQTAAECLTGWINPTFSAGDEV